MQVGLRSPFRPAFDLFFSGRGMLLVSPLVVLALVVAVPVAMGDAIPARVHARVALAVMALYVLWVASFQGSELTEHPGPRFLIVAVPFLAAPLAAMWEKIRPLAIVAAVWGGAFGFVATVTPLLVNPGASLFAIYRTRVRAHDFVPTLWSIGVGPGAALLYAAGIAAAIIWLVRVAQRSEPVDAPAAAALAAP
jgi:hypothetical protein